MRMVLRAIEVDARSRTLNINAGLDEIDADRVAIKNCV